MPLAEFNFYHWGETSWRHSPTDIYVAMYRPLAATPKRRTRKREDDWLALTHATYFSRKRAKGDV